MTLKVPAGETGAKQIQGEVEWSLIDLTGKPYSGVRPVSASGLRPAALIGQPSPAARLEVDVSSGQSRLTVQGVVGRTYTLEQTPWFPTSTQGPQMWVFMGDITLTNSSQVFVDPFPMVSSGSTFYRATILK